MEVLFAFQGHGDEAWCGLIPERAQLRQEGLINAIELNLKEVADEARMVQRSRAFVNGLRGDIVEMEASFDGFDAVYLTFAWSGSPGTIQVSCWTFPNLIDEYRPKFAEFYGGFELTNR